MAALTQISMGFNPDYNLNFKKRVRNAAEIDQDFRFESEAQLWSRFLNGDENAFISIYRRYVHVLFNYGKKFCSDTDLLKDCIQDFFIYLRDKRAGLGKTTSIKYYLLRSFKRKLFLYMEKSNKECQMTEFLELEVMDCDIQKFIDEEARAYMIRKLNQSISKICSKEREALYYYYYEELSYEEIADIMNYSHVSSARRLVYNALSNMKQTLSGCVG